FSGQDARTTRFLSLISVLCEYRKLLAVDKTQKNREKFYFQVLTKNFKNVIIILIRKNYRKLFIVGCVSDSVTHH
ncbi:hypothetical protein, partial [Anabaena sp. FACHB-1391]|uniref:hypothetical protein n=1 Tax=Anabaena sp. FACHB-1391 TaxID=2692771 RepID=UPI001A7E611E